MKDFQRYQFSPKLRSNLVQTGDRVGGRGPSRFNGFPAGPGGTGYQPVPLGNLPNGMGSALEQSERVPIFQRHRRSVRQVAGRHRLVACATHATIPPLPGPRAGLRFMP